MAIDPAKTDGQHAVAADVPTRETGPGPQHVRHYPRIRGAHDARDRR